MESEFQMENSVKNDDLNYEHSLPKRRKLSTGRETVRIAAGKEEASAQSTDVSKEKDQPDAMLNHQQPNKKVSSEVDALTTEEVLLSTPSLLCNESRTTEVEKVQQKQVYLLKQNSFGKQNEDKEAKLKSEQQACYRDLSLIGNGAYGTVYKAKDLTNGQFVALKKVRIPITEDGLPISTLREIATLKQLERFEHPHIVKLLDVCQGNGSELPISNEDITNPTVDRSLTLWLVFEHIDQDLTSYLESQNGVPLSAELARQMSKEILLAVDFLHSHRILHRDLKPQNLLVTSDGRIKVADFGLAKTYDFEMRLTSVVVTLWYRAPEVLLGCTYATPVDIWSIGCILAEINRLKPLFPGSSEGDQLDRIFQVIGTPQQDEWPDNVSLSWTAFPQRLPRQLNTIVSNLSNDGIDLIGSTLVFDPRKRISASQALKHPYFRNNNFIA